MATEEQQVKMDKARESFGTALSPNLIDFTNPAEFRKLAKEMFALYVRAEQAILLSQSYQIGGQSLTRADLEKVRKGRQEWQGIVETVSGGGGRRRFTQLIPVSS